MGTIPIARATVPRVLRLPEDLVEGLGAGTELRNVGLPQRDRSGRSEPLDDEIVALGNVLRE
jgi:hypothetical protein